MTEEGGLGGGEELGEWGETEDGALLFTAVQLLKTTTASRVGKWGGMEVR